MAKGYSKKEKDFLNLVGLEKTGKYFTRRDLKTALDGKWYSEEESFNFFSKLNRQLEQRERNKNIPVTNSNEGNDKVRYWHNPEKFDYTYNADYEPISNKPIYGLDTPKLNTPKPEPKPYTRESTEVNVIDSVYDRYINGDYDRKRAENKINQHAEKLLSSGGMYTDEDLLKLEGEYSIETQDPVLNIMAEAQEEKRADKEIKRKSLEQEYENISRYHQPEVSQFDEDYLDYNSVEQDTVDELEDLYETNNSQKNKPKYAFPTEEDYNYELPEPIDPKYNRENFRDIEKSKGNEPSLRVIDDGKIDYKTYYKARQYGIDTGDFTDGAALRQHADDYWTLREVATGKARVNEENGFNFLGNDRSRTQFLWDNDKNARSAVRDTFIRDPNTMFYADASDEMIEDAYRYWNNADNQEAFIRNKVLNGEYENSFGFKKGTKWEDLSKQQKQRLMDDFRENDIKKFNNLMETTEDIESIIEDVGDTPRTGLPGSQGNPPPVAKPKKEGFFSRLKNKKIHPQEPESNAPLSANAKETYFTVEGARRNFNKSVGVEDRINAINDYIKNNKDATDQMKKAMSAYRDELESVYKAGKTTKMPNMSEMLSKSGLNKKEIGDIEGFVNNGLKKAMDTNTNGIGKALKRKNLGVAGAIAAVGAAWVASEIWDE